MPKDSARAASWHQRAARRAYFPAQLEKRMEATQLEKARALGAH